MKRITKQEFKIGDKIKVVNSKHLDYDGQKGTIIDFDLSYIEPVHHRHNGMPIGPPPSDLDGVVWIYNIKFDEPSNISEGSEIFGIFSEYELEASNGITKAIQRTLPYETCAVESNIFHKQECPYCNKTCSVETVVTMRSHSYTFIMHEKCEHFKKIGAGMYFIFTKTEKKSE